MSMSGKEPQLTEQLRANSKNAKDFLEKSVDVMPFEIKNIQINM
jgi:hypothetical protein